MEWAGAVYADVKATSGATAVQAVWSSRPWLREIELGSARDQAEFEALKAAAQQRLKAGQLEFGLGLEHAGGGRAASTLASRVLVRILVK